jgi:hypothetical protein
MAKRWSKAPAVAAEPHWMANEYNKKTCMTLYQAFTDARDFLQQHQRLNHRCARLPRPGAVRRA